MKNFFNKNEYFTLLTKYPAIQVKAIEYELQVSTLFPQAKHTPYK
jgi:hypothetical protein